MEVRPASSIGSPPPLRPVCGPAWWAGGNRDQGREVGDGGTGPGSGRWWRRWPWGTPVTGLYALAVGSVVSYSVAVLVPALDALIPLLPSETVVIALGVATAGSTDPRIGVLVVLAAFGAFLGDNATYLLGRRFGPAVAGRFFAGER